MKLKIIGNWLYSKYGLHDQYNKLNFADISVFHTCVITITKFLRGFRNLTQTIIFLSLTDSGICPAKY